MYIKRLLPIIINEMKIFSISSRKGKQNNKYKVRGIAPDFYML